MPTDTGFDCVGIECFEHMKNYKKLYQGVALMYGVDEPAEMLKMWRYVDRGLSLLGLPPLPETAEIKQRSLLL